MIQRLKEAPWLKPAALALSFLLMLTMWQWLAGALFLARFGQDYTEAKPLTLYRYWYYYRAQPHVGLWINICAIVAAVVLTGLAFVVWKPKKKSLYGDSRLGTKRDMKKAGLFGEDGILVGIFAGMYLRVSRGLHVLLRAPTGEGKGVAVIIPTVLAWKESLIAFDLKGELLRITSGFRAFFQAVFVFNPFSETYQTHRFNPLGYLPDDPNLRINEIQKIAHFFYPDRPEEKPIWTATPRSLFLGIVMMLCETPGKLVTIGQVRRESLADGDGSEYFKRIVKERAEAGKPLSPECVSSLNAYTSIEADETRAGIITGFRASLELWANPLVDAATSANDFDLRLLRKKPMTIYLAITQDNLLRVAPLLRLFYQQMLDLNTRVELGKDKEEELKHYCLLVQDERAALGPIEALDKGIAFLRSYGFSILSVFQSMGQINQLLNRYGAESYNANHAVKIVYPPNPDETEDAEHISRAMGHITVKEKTPNGKGGYTVSQKPRRLMLPEEVVGLDSRKAIIMKRGMPAAVVEKIQYFSDRAFTERLLPPVDVPVLDMAAHNRAVAASMPAPRNGVAFVEAGTVVRPIGPEDVPKLDNLALSQFVLNFSTGAPPPSDTLDIKALDAYADRLCREAGINVEVTNG